MKAKWFWFAAGLLLLSSCGPTRRFVKKDTCVSTGVPGIERCESLE